jgi:hypothetical protein
MELDEKSRQRGGRPRGAGYKNNKALLTGGPDQNDKVPFAKNNKKISPLIAGIFLPSFRAKKSDHSVVAKEEENFRLSALEEDELACKQVQLR